MNLISYEELKQDQGLSPLHLISKEGVAEKLKTIKNFKLGVDRKSHFQVQLLIMYYSLPFLEKSICIHV